VHDRRGVETELVRGQQNACAEALDLEAARRLRVEAVPEPAGREDREREDDEHGDRGEDAERAQGLPAARDRPQVDRREREEDKRVELRGHREPEEAEAEQLTPAQHRSKCADGERSRKEVVRVERDRADRDRGEREQHGGCIDAVLRGTERHEREQDGEQRRDPAPGHQRLEGRVVGAAGQHGRREEHRERPRRVLDEDVAVRDHFAQEAVRVDPVEMNVAVALGAEETAVGNRAGEEEERRGECRDARGQLRAGVRGYGCGGGGAGGGGSAGGGGGCGAGGGGAGFAGGGGWAGGGGGGSAGGGW